VVSRRRTAHAVATRPGGRRVVRILPTSTPAEVTRFVRQIAFRLEAHARQMAERVPRHPDKRLVDGCELIWLGRTVRLHLVDTPVPVRLRQQEDGTGLLVVFRGDTERHGAQPVIGWYVRVGRAWLGGVAPARWSRLRTRRRLPRLEVRDLGRCSGAIYQMRAHQLTLHWAAFQTPAGSPGVRPGARDAATGPVSWAGIPGSAAARHSRRAEPSHRKKPAQVTVAGKTLRGAVRPDGRQVHLVSALRTDGVVLAQREVPSRTNEITAFKPLLAPLDLAGHVITFDALLTQTALARFLVEEKNAHYIAVLKANHPGLHQLVRQLSWRHVPLGHRSRDTSRGRDEIRRVKAATVNRLPFPHAAQALQIVRRTVPGREDHHRPRLRPDQPRHPPRTSRGTHRIRKTALADREQGAPRPRRDLRRGRLPRPHRHHPRAMAGLRNLALGILRLDGWTNIAKGLRRHNRRPNRPLTTLGINRQNSIRQTNPHHTATGPTTKTTRPCPYSST
jgi:predicted transposase YbfD/YdcC